MSARGDLPPRLRDLLGGFAARAGMEDAGAIGAVWARWSDIVGAGVAANAEPTSLKAGVLRIRATSPVWANELMYLADEIRARANDVAGAEIVREVRVWTGPGPVTSVTRRAPEASLYDHTPGASAGASRDGEKGASEDVATAFHRARAAWAKRRAKGP